MRDVGRLLVVAGIAMVIAGIAITLLSRSGIGKLPGDFVVRRGNFTFYFPLMTSILLSLFLSFLFWLFRR